MKPIQSVTSISGSIQFPRRHTQPPALFPFSLGCIKASLFVIPEFPFDNFENERIASVAIISPPICTVWGEKIQVEKERPYRMAFLLLQGVRGLFLDPCHSPAGIIWGRFIRAERCCEERGRRRLDRGRNSGKRVKKKEREFRGAQGVTAGEKECLGERRRE